MGLPGPQAPSSQAGAAGVSSAQGSESYGGGGHKSQSDCIAWGRNPGMASSFSSSRGDRDPKPTQHGQCAAHKAPSAPMSPPASGRHQQTRQTGLASRHGGSRKQQITPAGRQAQSWHSDSCCCYPTGPHSRRHVHSISQQRVSEGPRAWRGRGAGEPAASKADPVAALGERCSDR